MSGMFGGGGQNIVNETPRISGLRIQTSCYGVAVPVVIGRQRCTGNLIYYNVCRLSDTNNSSRAVVVAAAAKVAAAAQPRQT